MGESYRNDQELKRKRIFGEVVVVTRDAYAGLQSQLKWRHIKDMEQGKANIAPSLFSYFFDIY